MTPVPKGLTKKQTLNWRNLIRSGKHPVKAAALAKGRTITHRP